MVWIVLGQLDRGVTWQEIVREWDGRVSEEAIGEASAIAVKAGTDLTCGNEYRALVEAVKNNLIAEAEINRSLERLFVARFKLGMFDPPERVSWAKILYSVNDSAEHRKVALEAARKSIVLLKNEGQVLPFKASVHSIAVIGPSAETPCALASIAKSMSGLLMTLPIHA